MEACQKLSRTKRRSTCWSVICDPAVWRNQCADALASTAARLSHSGPRAQALGSHPEHLLQHQVQRAA